MAAARVDSMRALVLLVAAGVLSSGCISVGYGAGVAAARVDTSPESSPLEYTRQVDYSRTYHQFRLVDTSGILLAGLVNIGRQSAARDAAVDQAIAAGAKSGDVVEYSYKPYEILPGPRITADLRLGLGPASTTFTGAGGVRYERGNYFAFDVGGEPLVWNPEGLPVMASVGASMLLESWGLDEQAGIGFEHDYLGLDVFGNGKIGVRLPGNVGLTGKLHVGLVSPLLGLLLGSPRLSWYGGLEAAWATPWKPLTVVGDFVYGSPLWLDLPFRGGFSTRFGVNAVVSIEALMPAPGNP
ncbi:MAG TPA: hypothetical protein VFZ09_37395 [Archangium sp.]|uniref:hypothetical protein n=1 Tax=Archangium sp. TaxID=1872627 RepID=UPI002E2EAAE3|nr:hypothetical protein [Archangium sp.]HEX5751957.1 hypothetical protein [Archangium sp.]